MNIDEAIDLLQANIEAGLFGEAQMVLSKIREYIRNGGEMEPKHYDQLRMGHARIMGNVVDNTPELQPTQLTP